jgi:hypothetical protein
MVIGGSNYLNLAVDSLHSFKKGEETTRQSTETKLYEVNGRYFTIVGLNSYNECSFPFIMQQMLQKTQSMAQAVEFFKIFLSEYLAKRIPEGFSSGQLSKSKPLNIDLVLVGFESGTPWIYQLSFSFNGDGEMELVPFIWTPTPEATGYYCCLGKREDLPDNVVPGFLKQYRDDSSWIFIGHQCEKFPDAVGWPIERVVIRPDSVARTEHTKPIGPLPSLDLMP